MLSETVPPRATGAGGPPRRGRDAAAAIGPRQGQTRMSTHRRMTAHDAREVTTERRQGMDQLLLHAQAWWDAQRFDQPVWQIAAWREQKLRHIQLHVAKALGKVVAAYDEGAGVTSGTGALARVRNEVLPDVVIYRSQLLNLFPEAGAPPSLAHHRTAVGTPKAAPLLRVVLGLSRASAQLAAYLEPRDVTQYVNHTGCRVTGIPTAMKRSIERPSFLGYTNTSLR